MTKEKEIALSREHMIRMSKLLYMKYKPLEIANIIGVSVDRFYRTYIPAGCPHERDDRGRIWIVGTHFRSWAEDVIAKKKRKNARPMKKDEAWCFKCNGRVKILDPKTIWSNRYIEMLQSDCQVCGTKVNRAKKKND
ncbi:MAG: DUF5679 domain-containing protein [Anaerolineae bacterium]|nr:DUF5679 domain-containing protein [Anaerolineae bacterium]